VRRVGWYDTGLAGSGPDYAVVIPTACRQGPGPGRLVQPPRCSICGEFGGLGGRYPAPARLLATPDAELRAAGLSGRKAATLKAVARAFDDRRLSNRRLHAMEASEVVEAVTQIKGIGEWTAHMLLMFSLGHPDVLPVGDYGVRKGAMSLYDLPELPKPPELEAVAEPWRPYRSVASWYLWRHVESIPPA